MIERNRMDMVLADVVVMRGIIQKHNLPIKAMLPVYSVQKLYPGFNKDKVDKRDRIDLALGQMHADGTVDQIFQRHVETSFSEIHKLATTNPAPLVLE